MVNDLYNETRYLKEPFCKVDVDEFLNSMKYEITDDINTISPAFIGEIMLYIKEFYAYEV